MSREYIVECVIPGYPGTIMHFLVRAETDADARRAAIAQQVERNPIYVIQRVYRAQPNDALSSFTLGMLCGAPAGLIVGLIIHLMGGF
jgi:hypothetical protein